MYINDYSNQWAYWFGTAAIQHTELSSATNTKSGTGSITGGLRGLSYPSNWTSAYRAEFLAALRTAAGGHITPLALQALNASGDPSVFFPILKLTPKVEGASALYLKFPISMVPHSSTAVKPSGSSPSEIFYGRFQNTNTNRSIINYAALTPESADAVTFNNTLNAFYVETAGTGLGDVTCEITDLEYRCLIDNDNGNIGMRFQLSGVLTDVDTEETDTDVAGEFIIWMSLGAAANAYGFEEQEGGLYPVPTSLIPLRDALNAHGTNFNTNIDVYDETQEDVNNMFLSNYVGTLAYTFVRFETPVGTIRCYTPMQFTHFITRSFTDNDTPRVYRVVKYRVVNTNVIEYDFVVDYLKDYWQHFGITAESMPLLLRSTDPDDYNKYMPDPKLPYSGTFLHTEYSSSSEQTVAIVFSQPDTETGRETGTLTFALEWDTYMEFLDWWMSDSVVLDHQEALLGRVVDVYLVPYSQYSDIYVSQIYSFSLPIVGTTQSATFTPTGTMYKLNTGHRNTSNLSNYVNGSIDCTGLDMSDGRWFMNPPIAHIPCYGDIQLPKTALYYLDRIGNIPFKYIVDINDGAVAISFEPYTDVLPAISLPRLPLPSCAAVQAIKQVNRSRLDAYASVGMSLGTSALGLGAFGQSAAGDSTLTTARARAASAAAAERANAGAALGSLGTGVGALMGTAVSLASAADRFDSLEKSITETVGVVGHKTSGIISLYQSATLRFTIPDLAISLPDFYGINGYPCLKKWQSALDGCRYWIELQGSLKGTEEYIAGVRAAIDGRGIVYNYT